MIDILIRDMFQVPNRASKVARLEIRNKTFSSSELFQLHYLENFHSQENCPIKLIINPLLLKPATFSWHFTMTIWQKSHTKGTNNTYTGKKKIFTKNTSPTESVKVTSPRKKACYYTTKKREHEGSKKSEVFDTINRFLKKFYSLDVEKKPHRIPVTRKKPDIFSFN